MIVPLSVSHSWSFVYGEQGCAKNQWRQNLFKIFQEWTRIASKKDIEYVLTCGTLLGALRTADVIPYDSDMDILVNIKYYQQLKKLSAERNFDPQDGKIRLVMQPQFELNVSTQSRKRYTCSGKLTPTMVDVCSFQDPMARLIRKYLHVDLYPFYEKGDHLLDTTDGDVRVYNKKDMYPLRPCTMMGFDSFCPQNPWNILHAYYRTKNFNATYKCNGKAWVDKNGRHA
ncbi:uncharacterized protein LOC110252464 [Exaiptasia diaphana]|uniref:LicD/FKTN/FKRP nucleotidyltransferase domain-containing protein n=1 Tax=Exaiptasia diaphana TaxID=2652724 RepID=A0A913Y4F1_EXADI|nr:uncharacterized protein LOC110252464 [Exaiptasia diaphana]KXJ22508.1 hypothetical protein AC249_AIPGENE2545 [Exaiptasia diaphana]